LKVNNQEKAKPVARQGRKATGFIETAGLQLINSAGLPVKLAERLFIFLVKGKPGS
jgi:hypothetical protein